MVQAPYPSITEYNLSKGFTEILVYNNLVTNNWVSNMLLIAIYMIFLFGYYSVKRDWLGGFAVAGFITFVIGLLFRVGGFITNLTMGILIGVLIVGAIGIFLPKDTA